jgi:hypothetical protein
MIVITYDPPGADAKKWEIDEDSWTYGETVEIERQYDGTRAEFFEAARDGSDTARRIMLWIVRRRTELELQLDDLNDLLVSYLGFWQIVPEADPKAGAAAPAATDTAPVTESPDSATS